MSLHRNVLVEGRALLVLNVWANPWPCNSRDPLYLFPDRITQAMADSQVARGHALRRHLSKQQGMVGPCPQIESLAIGPDRILCSGLSSRFLEPSKRKECSPETPGYLGLNFFITYHRKQLGSKAPSTYSIPARLSNCFRTCIQGPERTRGCRKSHQFVQWRGALHARSTKKNTTHWNLMDDVYTYI